MKDAEPNCSGEENWIRPVSWALIFISALIFWVLLLLAIIDWLSR
jgi:hypothetical protein